MHKGTVDAGHYFAFIKPNIDERWFEFNDTRVSEVSKYHALGQGAGGNTTTFSQMYHGNPYYKDSCGQLIERYDEDDTNAYMLFYVRESERNTIMNDHLGIEDRLPRELSQYFQIEELLSDQIHEDNKTSQLNKFYLMTDVTLAEAKYNGALFANKTKDQSEPNGFDSDRSLRHHMLLYVSPLVSVNAFIMMIKRRFFADDDNVELEDIWLYRSHQSRQQDSPMHRGELLQKYTFGKH